MNTEGSLQLMNKLLHWIQVRAPNLIFRHRDREVSQAESETSPDCVSQGFALRQSFFALI